jgi:hypothetical protein
MKFDMEHMYLASTNGRENGKIVTLIEIDHSENSMMSGIFYDDSFASKRTYAEYDHCILLDEGAHESFFRGAKRIDGWVLLGESDSMKYIVSKSRDIEDASSREFKDLMMNRGDEKTRKELLLEGYRNIPDLKISDDDVYYR